MSQTSPPQDAPGKAFEHIGWNLPALPPDAGSLLREASLPVQPLLVSYWRNAQPSEAKAISPILKTSQGPLGPWAFLSACVLKRSAANQYAQMPKPPTLDFFDFDAPTKHLGMRWLLGRQGNLAKALLSQGCHPAFLFTTRLDPSPPSPFDCGQLICLLGAKASNDALKTLFNAFDSIEHAREAFRAGVVHGALKEARAIWIHRSGVANRAEASATLNLAPILERLARKKALPPEIKELAGAVEAKLPLARGRMEEEAIVSFTDIQLRRQRAMAALASGDDVEAVAAMLPLCGLDRPEAFASGIAKGLELDLKGRYWASAYSLRDSYSCAALFVERGDNPWLMAGDGSQGQQAGSNPFLWLALHSPNKESRIATFPAFAQAFCQGALRDAETRSPGSGRALCQESFEQAKAHRLWPKDSPIVAATVAAAENALLRLHVKTDPPQPAPAPSARTRL